MPKRRPFGVTLFLWMVLSLSGWGAVRLLAALRWWRVLDEFDARLSPLYLAITGAVWILAGAVLLWSIWSAKAWAHWGIPLSIGLWLAEYWIERSVFQSSRANVTFAVVASALLVFITAIITLNKHTREFFMGSEAYEQPNQDSTSA